MKVIRVPQFNMGKYSGNYASDVSKNYPASLAVTARGRNLKVSYKNTTEVANAIKGMTVAKATVYLQQVKRHKAAIPFRHFNKKVGRHAQGKRFNAAQSRWPEKSVDVMLNLLRNLAANTADPNKKGDLSGAEAGDLMIVHAQVNQAPNHRRRTYRAHGRINPWLGTPSHVELCAVYQKAFVKKSGSAVQSA